MQTSARRCRPARHAIGQSGCGIAVSLAGPVRRLLVGRFYGVAAGPAGARNAGGCVSISRKRLREAAAHNERADLRDNFETCCRLVVAAAAARPHQLKAIKAALLSGIQVIGCRRETWACYLLGPAHCALLTRPPICGPARTGPILIRFQVPPRYRWRGGHLEGPRRRAAPRGRHFGRESASDIAFVADGMFGAKVSAVLRETSLARATHT